MLDFTPMGTLVTADYCSLCVELSLKYQTQSKLGDLTGSHGNIVIPLVFTEERGN
jgi:hypothetical protein